MACDEVSVPREWSVFAETGRGGVCPGPLTEARLSHCGALRPADPLAPSVH